MLWMSGGADMTKGKTWIVGSLVAVAAVVAVLLNRQDNQLVVHLVDKQTGRPASASVKVQEGRLSPVISLLTFLPDRMRYSVKASSFVTRDGTFKIQRIGGR